MRNPQIGIDAAVSGIDFVEFGGGVIGRAGALIAFAGLVGGGGGDQGDAAPAERLFERLERYLGIMRPAIRRRIAERQIIVPDPLHIGIGASSSGANPKLGSVWLISTLADGQAVDRGKGPLP